MANQPIPTLPVAVTIDGTEQLECVQPPGSGGTSKRLTAAQIALLGSTSTGGLSPFVMMTTGSAFPNARGLSVNADLSLTDNGSGHTVVIGPITTAAVTYAKFQQSAPASVLGVAGASTAVIAPITGTASTVLQVNSGGNGLSFALLNTASLTGVISVPGGGTGASTLTSFGVLFGNGTGVIAASSAASAGQLLVGQTSTSNPAWVTIGGAISLTSGGTASLSTGSITSASLATGSVTFPKIQTMTGLSVMGVSGTATAAPNVIVGTANQVLVVNPGGTSLAFGQVNLSSTASWTGLLTALGTVTTGTWQATKIGLAYGGTNSDLSATGGTSQVLKQTSAGTSITVGQLNFTDLSGSIGTSQITAATIGSVAGLTWTTLSKTANYTVANGDKGKNLVLGGNSFFTLSVGAVGGYDSNFAIAITNTDNWGSGRAKYISCSGGPEFYLWPQTSCTLFNNGSAWETQRSPRVKLPSGVVNVYADFNNGSDTDGSADGLATGTGSFKTVERAIVMAADQFDLCASTQTQLTINMAAATNDTAGVHAPVQAQIGAQGGAAIRIFGATLSISNVTNSSGHCLLTLSSNSSYNNNQLVSVHGVGGVTAANGTWAVTKVSSNQLLLQNSTFSGVYTSGGTISNGSGFATTGAACLGLYFGTVLQLSDILMLSNTTCFGLQWGAKAYILDGCIFSGDASAPMIAVSDSAHLEIDGAIGIASGAYAIFQATNGGSIASIGDINFQPAIGCAFSSTAFAATGGRITSVSTINLNGTTVTGTRSSAQSLGLIVSANGSATYWPGNSANSTSSGGQSI